MRCGEQGPRPGAGALPLRPLGQCNFFSFCLQDDKEQGDGSEEEEDEEPSSPQAAPPPPPQPKPTGGGRKAAKKKKKAAGKGKARAADESSADSDEAAPAGAADEEELDAILAEMNLQVREREGLLPVRCEWLAAVTLCRPAYVSPPARLRSLPNGRGRRFPRAGCPFGVWPALEQPSNGSRPSARDS